MFKNKKLFLIGGYPGIIYYSWLLIVLLLTIVLCFESVNGFNWWPVVTGTIFIIGSCYSLLNTYFKNTASGQIIIKTPYTKVIELENNQIEIKKSTTYFESGIIKHTRLQPISFYRIKAVKIKRRKRDK